jgi:hypothetical protein
MRDNVTKVLGLITQYNPLSTQPGALVQADDCVNRRQNILEDRRGYKTYATMSNNGAQYFAFNSKVLIHNGTVISYDSDGAGTLANYSGSYSAPSGAKSQGIEAYSNLYVTTSKGVQVFEDTSGTAARYAGAPRALDISYSLNAAVTGFLAANSQCAYRAVIQRTDSNSNILYGYPSQRLVVLNPDVSITGDTTNGSPTIANVSSFTDVIDGMSISGAGIPAGATISSHNSGANTITLSANATATATGVTLTLSASRNIDLTTYLPSECKAGDVYQFYRTSQVSGTSDDSSGEEEGLVYQVTLSSTDISNGYVTFTDSITDSLIGATIYTAPSQEGIQQANDRPPLCKDIALYKNNFMFYANTSTKQRLYFSLVGTGSLSGKTITLGGVTYNFGSTEIISGAGSPQAEVGSTGVVAADIDSTARSLCKVINRYASNTSVYAYYLSGPSDLPGQIMIEEQGIGGAAFTIQASDTAISGDFFPNPPVSPATNSASTSSNTVQKNAIFYSKEQEPEAVPPLNYLLVGEANKNILRIAPLRDSLIVIKEEGVYRLTGQDPSSFVVAPLDLTVKCKAINSVAVLSNVVYMLSNQGVVAISETGVQVTSEDIQATLLPILQNSSLSSICYAVPYESEHEYIISLPATTTDTAQTQTFVYNIFTQTWVRWTFAIACGIVEPGADKLYFSKPSSDVVYIERKTFTDDDFADPEISISITVISGSLVTFTSTSAPAVGWAIKQGTTALAITAIVTNASSYTATLEDTPPASWTTGAATAYPSVNMAIKWNAWTANAPSLMKQVRAAAILADDINAYNTVSRLILTFATNFDPATEEQALTQPGEGWGGTWGTSAWGGEGDSFGYPTWVPRNKQYCTRMYFGVKHQNALERLAIAGVSFEYDTVSEEIGR